MTRCKLCGGDFGVFSPGGSHYLCEARAVNGQSTPNLGNSCPDCSGSGVKRGFHGGLMLDLDLGPAKIARSIDAQFPACETCRGKGYR